MQAASLFNQDEKTMKILNKELYDFNFFRALKEILLRTKHDMIEICRNYYRVNRNELSKAFKHFHGRLVAIVAARCKTLHVQPQFFLAEESYVYYSEYKYTLSTITTI